MVASLIFKGAALEGGYLIGEAIYQILRYTILYKIWPTQQLQLKPDYEYNFWLTKQKFYITFSVGDNVSARVITPWVTQNFFPAIEIIHKAVHDMV